MNRIRVLKTNLDKLTLDGVKETVSMMINSEDSYYVCFCEAHLNVQAYYKKEISNVLEEADLVLPDGVAMTLGARLLGQKFPARLPGPLIMLEICRDGVDKGYKHYFYGGEAETPELLEKNLKELIPGLNVVGHYSPPFRPLTEDEKEDVAKRISDAKPDIIWVGLGAPKQELWMNEFKGRLKHGVMFGVGAAFDFHAGKIKWAPRWIRKIGLEWLYRMFTGGKRVFIRNVKYESTFILLILNQALRSKSGNRE